MVWVALCRSAKVGIDVEKIRPLPDAADLTSQLHPLERQELLALPPEKLEAAFYRCWTRKEAVLKAVGMGLSMPLHSFCVHTGPQTSGWIPAAAEEEINQDAPPVVGEQWTSRDIPSSIGYQCSVAAHAPRTDVLIHLAR